MKIPWKPLDGAGGPHGSAGHMWLVEHGEMVSGDAQHLAAGVLEESLP